MMERFYMMIWWFFMTISELIDSLNFWLVEFCRRLADWAEDRAHGIDKDKGK